MKSLIIEQQNPGFYAISGDLTFATINHKTLIALIPADNATVNLDFAQVNASDSAGLALIIEWLKSAHSRQITLHLEHLPEQVLSLAKLGGMDTLLNTAT